MDTHDYISTGYVTKTENVQSITSNIIKGTLVLDALEPFPGYHGDLPGDEKPHYVFLVLKEPYSHEAIVRATQRIKRYCQCPFEAHYTLLNIYNNEYYFAIRLRKLQDYAHLPDIQGCYMDEGLEFAKDRKVNTIGILKVYKYFHMQQEAEHIFKDVNETCIHYAEIPRDMNWKLFVEVTKQVKNNVTSDFDAALASIYQYQTFRDFVRIYCHKDDIEAMKYTRAKYIEIMNQYF